MIDFNNVEQNEELETASKNIPEILNITGNVKSDIFQVDVDFFLIPFNSERKIKVEDILFYNHAEQEWGIVSDGLKQNADATCKMYCNKIPEKFDFIDFYFQNYNDDIINNCTISFLDKNLDKLFSYTFQTMMSNDCQSVFLGTFARVSNGWKFYPKFETYEGDINNVFQAYKEVIY